MGMSFGEALIYIRSGKRLCRSGWNGKGQSVILHFPDTSQQPYFRLLHEECIKTYVWVPSTSDILAFDWMFAEGK